jgi:hypothetical protein
LEALLTNLQLPSLSEPTYTKLAKHVYQSSTILAQQSTQHHLAQEVILTSTLTLSPTTTTSTIPSLISTIFLSSSPTTIPTSPHNNQIGIAYDSAWQKHSYGHSHNFSNGLEAFVGILTKKIVFWDTRSKNCQCPKKGHKCLGGWKESSKAMKPDICLGGIKVLTANRVKVGELLMNGDAIVMAWIKERLPLEQQNISCWFCNNHIIKELVKEWQK